MVMVQDGRQAVDVLCDGQCAVAIGHAYPGNQPGQQRKLPPQHVMHHDHLPPVEERGRIGIGGRGGRDCWSWLA